MFTINEYAEMIHKYEVPGKISAEEAQKIVIKKFPDMRNNELDEKLRSIVKTSKEIASNIEDCRNNCPYRGRRFF